jgi:flagellar motor protein MotB
MSRAADSFSHSLTDLMASVAVMFLLIAAIFMIRAKAEAKRAADAARKSEEVLVAARNVDQTSRDAARELADLLRLLRSKGQMRAEVLYDPAQDPYLVTIVFGEGILRFDLGRQEPDAFGQETIRNEGPKILQAVCPLAEKTGRLQQITLEGHTDDQPFPVRSFEKNVELSAQRAQSVYFRLREAIEGRPDLLSCLDERFVVSGRGYSEPVVKEATTSEDRSANRRVVIKVRMRSDVRISESAPSAE